MEMSGFQNGLDAVTFNSKGRKLLGGFYRAAGSAPRPTAVLLHGTPGIEKHLDIAYRLRDLGWNCLYFHFRGSWGSEGPFSFAGLPEDAEAAVTWVLRQPPVDGDRIALVGGAMGGHAALLHGARGQDSVDLNAVSAVIERVSRLALALGPHLLALEINPLLVTGSHVEALDVLVSWQA